MKPALRYSWILFFSLFKSSETCVTLFLDSLSLCSSLAKPALRYSWIFFFSLFKSSETCVTLFLDSLSLCSSLAKPALRYSWISILFSLRHDDFYFVHIYNIYVCYLVVLLLSIFLVVLNYPSGKVAIFSFFFVRVSGSMV